jgi:Tfp pilus assembly protein PilW
MSGDRGYTLVELTIATAIMLTVTGAVMTLLHDSLARTPVLEDATDLHQRARVVAEALAVDLRAAGSGTPSGPLTASFPAIEPRALAAAAASAAADAVTIRYVPPHAGRSRLLQPLDPAAAVAAVDLTGCPQGTTACGFTAGVRGFVFDAAGQMDTVQVDAISPGMLLLGASVPGRTVTYAAGSEIAEAREVSYALDAPTRQLRRTEGGGTFAVVDNVEALTFEYRGDGAAALPLSVFQDGPFRGTGDRMFDTDTLGIRVIVATVRLASGSARVPAVTARVTVALRNGG